MQTYLRYIVFFYALLFLFFIFESVDAAANKSEAKTATGAACTKTIKNKQSSSVKASAKEGVTLLEQILEKMHTMPQIALSRTKSSLECNKEILAAKTSKLSDVCDAAPIIASSKTSLNNQINQLDYVQKDKSQAAAGGLPLLSSTNLKSKLYATPTYYHSNPSNCTGQLPTSIAQNIGGRSATSTAVDQIKSEEGLSCRQLSGKRESPYVEANGSVCKVKRAASLPPLTEFASVPRILDCKSISNTNLALLPPTVIKGIPLVSLNDAEKRVLERITKDPTFISKKEAIRDWSVFSLHKDGSSTCAIQIFLRKGVVEAIRVFDSSFLRQDFETGLGKDLSVVKEKYGEPAFILTERVPGISQNYIYPLNQVAFRFSRTTPNNPPTVTSLIIFNVH